MRKPRSALVLLLLLGFGVSLIVPAEDVPETAYDESETLPCESTPLFSSGALQAVARPLQSAPSFRSPAGPSYRTRRDQGRAKCRELAGHAANYLTLLDCQLRR